jgi:hypothetical protein
MRNKSQEFVTELFLPYFEFKCSQVRDDAGDGLRSRMVTSFASIAMSNLSVLPHRVRDLSSPRRHLISLMQRINFGRIEYLLIQGGNPVLTPPPTVVRELKFSGENGPRQETGRTDFELKEQHRELFRILDEVGDGTITVLTIKHGLPFHAELPA